MSTFLAVRQVRRPSGTPVADDFTVVTEPLPALADEQVLVENVYVSVDPYMRQLMNTGEAGLEGRAIGRVVESRSPQLPVGTTVFHRRGWSTHAVADAAEVRRVHQADGVPLSAYLGVLGGTGLTAFVGLTRIARLEPGEDLFVSAAAGGVGSAAGQIARLMGAGRVIGSAGSAAKVAHLREIGFDAAFDHHDGPVAEQLTRLAPDGIDVYLDNVGGDHLAAAIAALRPHGRVAWSGAIAQYSSAPPAAPHNLADVMFKSLRVEGFLVREHLDLRERFERFLVPHVRNGSVRVSETVVDGFENLVEAFLGVLRGDNTGKMLVRVTRPVDQAEVSVLSQ
ncbi:NADP-dependent oxidoreductase [Nocardia sp. NRRL S-836]|uniref:NADP-dependent oxidoreductase n=1 Tax=Nocardia sp. NRRL S-836 TaxID=1519492 RepID=UPI0006AFF7BA|nr:NADP-dependent oxidoreductase [Nocardia sp. NRRL S-836]KOV85262.1 NADP-dependent oxidoreductase [Nocardia sp. NRRL S-836]